MEDVSARIKIVEASLVKVEAKIDAVEEELVKINSRFDVVGLDEKEKEYLRKKR